MKITNNKKKRQTVNAGIKTHITLLFVAIAIIILATYILADVSSITLSSPADNAWVKDSSPDFTFSYIGNETFETCTLLLNNNDPCGTIINLINNTNGTISSTCPLSEGINLWKVNCVSNNYTSAIRTINIDTTTPSTSDDAPANWTTASVTVAFTITNPDGLSSTNTYYCTGVGCTPTTLGSSVMVSSEGTTTIKYKSNDTAGNQENIKTTTVMIDKTVPVTVDDAPVGWSPADVLVNFTVTNPDGYSTTNTYYCLGAGCTPTTLGSSVMVSSEGTTTIRYKSNDTVGNQEAINTATVMIDKTVPVTVDDAPTGWMPGNVRVNFTVTNPDVYSTTKTYYCLGTSCEPNIEANYVIITAEGNTTIRYKSNDTSGNDESVKETYVAIDKTSPVTVDDAPTGWMPADVRVNFTVTNSDSYSTTTTYYCINTSGTSCDPNTAANYVLITAEGNTTIRYKSNDTSGNDESVKETYVAIDKTKPSITLVSPTINSSNQNQNLFNFTFNTIDALSKTENCSLIVGGAVNTSNPSVTNNTQTSFLNVAFGDGTQNWAVSCTDLAGNTNTSTYNTLIVNVTADKAEVYPINPLTNESTITVYGYVNRANHGTNVTVYVQQDPLQNKASKLVTAVSNYLGASIIMQDQAENTSYFYIQNGTTLPTGFDAGNFVGFGHYEPFMQYYEILKTKYYPWGWQINITPALSSSINTSESVEAYDAKNPTGWFNITVPLFEGNNTIKVETRRLGTVSPQSDSYYIFKDTTEPTINLSSINLYNTANPIIDFMLTDNHRVNVSSVMINLSNGTDFLTYNYSDVTCTLPTCSISLIGLADGTHTFEVSVRDFVGEINTTSNSFTIDTKPPGITLSTPDQSAIEIITRNMTFSFSAEDDYSTALNCSLNVTGIVNNTEEYSYGNIIMSNASTNTTSITNLTDGTYTWLAQCYDEAGNLNSSEVRNFTMNNKPQEHLDEPKTLVSTNSLSLVGYVGAPGTTINFTVTQGDLQRMVVQNLTTEYALEYNQSINLQVKKQDSPARTNYIYINKTYTEIFNHTNRYISFTGTGDYHNKYYLNYQIKNVTDYGSPTYAQVFLETNLTRNVSQNAQINVYNQSKPSGWFNQTLTNLYGGYNNITIKSQRQGLIGNGLTFEVYYDSESPVLNLSGIPTNMTVNLREFNFSATDNHNLSIETAYVNISNGTNSTVHIMNPETYNVPYNYSTWNLGQNLTCNFDYTSMTCYVSPYLSNGQYNVTVTINDTAGHQTTQTKQLFVAATVAPPLSVNDTGATTDNLTSLIFNWENVSSQQYFSHYEIAVGTVQYPSNGWNDTLEWTNVGTNTTQIVNGMTLLPGTVYYGTVRAVNIYGANSSGTSSNGIVIEDNTVPVYKPGSAKWIGTDIADLWTNEITTLKATWNFTDNETGISEYEYAIGTAPYPQTGWDSIVSQTQTITNNFNETGLNLSQNTSYYFSVKAKNGYQYSFGWSDWYSSSYIKQDLADPIGGQITYNPGDYTAGTILIRYKTGDDALSGYNYAQMLKKESTYDPINSGCGAYSQYAVLNASMTHTDTLTNYYYNSLQDGRCYKFALKVYDKAGNYVIYTLGNEDYNVTADSTPPQSFVVNDTGAVTGSRNLAFTWAEAIDPHTGIERYEYALGTTQGGEEIINFTNNGLLRSISLTNLNLVDEQTYYLTVKAYNRVGLATTSYSDGIIYLDMDTPEPLTVYRIQNDTNSTDGYFDFDSDLNTTVYLTGEQGLTCVWSYYDIDYTSPGPLTNYTWACVNTINDPVTRIGNYTCEIRTPTERLYNAHVNCKDDAANKQLQTENTDLFFYKENQGPQINITNPENNSIVNGIINVNISVWDLSNYSLTYLVKKVPENISVIYRNVTDETNIHINTTSLDGEYRLTFYGVDEYNHSSESSVNFIVNNNAPTVSIILPAQYQKQDFNFSIVSTLFTNMSYNITKSNNVSTVIQTGQANFPDMQTTNTTRIAVDVDALTEGAYTINVWAKDNKSTNRTTTKEFVVDTTMPELKGPFEVMPTTIRYENDTIKLYLNFKELSLDKVWVRNNANGSYVNYTATPTTPGAYVYENFTRYKVEIPSYLTEPNETITYTWHARDLAGNENYSAVKTVKISNRVVNITTNNLTDALEGYAYNELVNFVDLDSQNSSDYNCSVSGLPITGTIVGSICELSWSNPTPAGTHEINITVNDKYNQTTKSLNLTIEPTDQQTVNINSSHSLTLEYTLQIGNQTRTTTKTTSTSTNLTLQESANYTLRIKRANMYVEATLFNITSTLDLFFQQLNPTHIVNPNSTNGSQIGSSKRYIPLDAYALKINVVPDQNKTYKVGFNYSSFNVPSNKLKIFKFGYNGEINYSDENIVSTVIDTNKKIAYVAVKNFSAFIITNDTGAPAEEPETPGGGGSHHGGSSTGGLGFYIAPTCNDGILNQGETTIDCGGPCGECTFNGTCHDLIQNQNEVGVDCGGVCSADCPTCSDGIKNGDETAIDCGGSCKSCEPIVTCTDGVQNGQETGVDCGGSCIPCVGCDNGIKDAGEEGVDCGGVCSNECGPTVIEKPVEIKNIPFYIWPILAGIIILGGLVAVGIYMKEQKLVKQKEQETIQTEEEVQELNEEEQSVISSYVRKYLEQGLNVNAVKSQLLMNGFKPGKVDVVTAAVLRDIKIQEIVDYMNQYTSQGYEVPELKEWILNQGIEEDLLAQAEIKYQELMNQKSNSLK